MVNEILHTKRTLRVWLYYRLSRDEDVELNSLNNQRGILVDFVDSKGYDIVGESFDDNVSGMHFEREGIHKLCEAVDKGLIDAVIVKDLSRLGRHRTQTAVFIDYLRQHKVKVLSVTENIDTSDENDDLLVGFKGIVNDLYAKDISKKIRAGYLQKQKNGIIITTPMGYYKDKNTDEIVIVEEEAQIIRRIYELYLSGYGMKSIMNLLNNEGVKAPQYYQNLRYKKKLPYTRPDICKKYLWNATTVKRVLQNEFYMGTLICHKYSTSKINHTRTAIPEEERFVHENYVPAIIPKEKWEQVQHIINQKSEGHVRASSSKPCHRYTGLIKCGDCGCIFSCKIRKRDGQADRIEYVCNGYHRYGRNQCTPHRINETEIDRLIYDEILRIKEIAMAKYQTVEDDIKRWMRQEGTVKGTIDKLNVQLEVHREDLKSLLLERIRDKAHADIYDDMIAKCELQIAWLEKEINSILDYNATIKSRKSDIKSTIELLEKIVQEGEITDANIRMLVNKIVVSEQNGMISIQIKLNAKFTNHILTCNEDGLDMTDISSICKSTKKDTLCNDQGVSYSYT